MDSIINSNISDHDLLLISITMLENMQKSMGSITKSLEDKADIDRVKRIEEGITSLDAKHNLLTTKVYTIGGILAGAQAIIQLLHK